MFKDFLLENEIKSYNSECFQLERSSNIIIDSLDTNNALNFRINIADCDLFEITYTNKEILAPYLQFFYPGIKGMIAFFYALEQGYEKVWLEEYDYPDAYFRMQALSKAGCKYFEFELSDFIYCDGQQTKLILNKQITLDNLKMTIRNTFSDENISAIIREECQGYCINHDILKEDLFELEKRIETWNFIRSLSWLYDKPLNKLKLEEIIR